MPYMMLLMIHQPHLHQPWRLNRCNPFIHSTLPRFLRSVCNHIAFLTCYVQLCTPSSDTFTGCGSRTTLYMLLCQATSSSINAFAGGLGCVLPR